MSESTAALIEAQDLHINGEYEKAADRLTAILNQEVLARPLLLDCLVQMGQTELLLDVFDPPSNEAEAIHVMDALWNNGKRVRLGRYWTPRLLLNPTTHQWSLSGTNILRGLDDCGEKRTYSI